jgi:putative acetyltransferase
MGTQEILIRPEQTEDIDAIRRVNELAFEQSAEAEIVDRLRQNEDDIISLVAIRDEQIIGHILFSPMTIQGEVEISGAMGLAPMSVLPECQRQGIGSKLIETGLNVLKTRHCPLVIVLGHPEYYPKFGFVPACRLGLKCQWPVPEGAFLALRLDPHLPIPIHAVAQYRPEFEPAML